MILWVGSLVMGWNLLLLELGFGVDLVGYLFGLVVGRSCFVVYRAV